MRLKPYVGLTLALVIVCAAYPALAQSAPSASEKSLPLAIGAGFSGYNPDFGHGHLLGGTLWIDYYPNKVPSILRGIGMEVEARDLNYGRSSTQPKNLRLDTIQGGVIYSWPHFRDLRPYAKFSGGYGNADDGVTATHRNHDSRTILSGGGGFEYRIFQKVWVRADYEYQSWPDFFKHPATAAKPARSSGRLNPQGFTLGAVYHFGDPRRH
jgi:opacity protein-like surface antigen